MLLMHLSCRIHSRVLLVALAIVAVLAVGASARADRVEDSTELILTLISDIETVLGEELSKEDIHRNTNRIIDTYFDYETIGRFTVGPYWRVASERQREAFLRAFREIIVQQTSSNLNYFRSIKYNHRSSIPKGDNWVLVTGLVHDSTGKNEDVMVSWRVSTQEGKAPFIFDLDVENVSMLITQKDENMAIIRQNKGDFDALVRVLEDRSRELQAERQEP